jgi:acetyl-CoA carboxylase biotin carboxyl carrier protein
MKIKELKELIEFMKENEITELEIEEEGKKIKLSRAQIQNMAAALPSQIAQPALTKKQDADSEKKQEQNLIEIKAPMVGTFYLAPSPDSEPYVSRGTPVKSGDVVCIIEAMKLMNEIKSEVKGQIAEIIAENGEPVEYGQTLFLVKPV